MKSVKKFAVPSVLAAGVVSLTLSQSAFAHVTVKPAEVATASYQTFTVSVPNEKNNPTTKIKLDIPEGLTSVTPTVKQGWTIEKKTEGEGESEKVTSVTWSGGEIDEGLRDEFTFSAKTPDDTSELRWDAYQTYEDGSTVAWDMNESKGGHSHDDFSSEGPASVTVVSADVESDHGHDRADEETEASGDWALYISVTALLVGFGALFAALYRK